MSGGAILLIGGTGQIGRETARRAPGIVAPPRAALDLARPDTIGAMIAARPWAAVINTAAYTAVDRAEDDVAAAWAVNAVGPAVLARETARRGIPLIHLSTDHVFDGAREAPYRPDDRPDPPNVYGASKLAGEIAVRGGNPRHAIVRTAWVMGAHGRGFVHAILAIARRGEIARVVADQHGCPTSAGDVADAVLTIARAFADVRGAAPSGTWHFVNRGHASRYELARAILDGARARGMAAPPAEPIATADRPAAARRPACSRLDTDSLKQVFGITPRPWRRALDDILDELLGPAGAAAAA